MRMVAALLIVLVVAGFAAFMALGPALTLPFGAAQEAPAAAETALPTDTPSATGYPTAVARHDVILRAAPAASAPTTGLIYAGSAIPLRGCSEDGLWCETAEGNWLTTGLLDGIPPALRPAATVAATAAEAPAAEATEAVEAETVSLLGLLPTPTVLAAAESPATVPAPAPTPAGPRAAESANLRGGPGTAYAVVGGVEAGQVLAVTGQSVAGDWYRLENGAWIAAFLVADAPAGVAVVAEVPAPPTATAIPVAAEPTTALSGAPTVVALSKDPVHAVEPSVVPIGQEIEGNGWRFKVAEVHKRKAVYFYGKAFVAMGHFLIVIVEAVNLQSGTDYFDRTIEPYVVDDPWSDTYFQSSAGTTYSKWQFGGLASTLTYVNPGDFVRIVMAFDVPDGEGHLLLSTDIPKWVDLGDFAAMPIEE